MEKLARSKSIVFSFLSRTISVKFSNPPFSPGRDKNSGKLKGHTGKGLSGPIISIVPAETRRKPKKNDCFEALEPCSPKVSCIGKIKNRKKICEVNCVSPPRQHGKKLFAVGKVFRGAKTGHRKSDADANANNMISSGRAPSLSLMKRFSNGRGAFVSFDWEDRRECYSDEEIGESDEENEFWVPHSAPLVVGGGLVLAPRTEVNLWKRRSMDPPRPLQLNGLKVT